MSLAAADGGAEAPQRLRYAKAACVHGKHAASPVAECAQVQPPTVTSQLSHKLPLPTLRRLRRAKVPVAVPQRTQARAPEARSAAGAASAPSATPSNARPKTAI